MLDYVREKFRAEGFIFPHQFLNVGETKFYQSKYLEYVKKYGTKGR